MQWTVDRASRFQGRGTTIDPLADWLLADEIDQPSVGRRRPTIPTPTGRCGF
jgi:hypothetical protein